MSNDKSMKKYGTHRRISDKNLERIKDLGRMGDSVDKAIGVLLDKAEDINRCLEGHEPITDDLRALKVKWFDEFRREQKEE